MTSPRSQPQYQIRFDWGVDGAAAIAPGADILVWVDALEPPAGEAAVDVAELPHDGAIVAGTVGSREAIARWVLECQEIIGDRATVAVVAAGTADGRFAVEDLLAAGAVIDALAEVGIDYISPEAAAAVGAYAGLRFATSHVLSASVSGQEIIATEGRDRVEAAVSRNAASDAEILREFRIRA